MLEHIPRRDQSDHHGRAGGLIWNEMNSLVEPDIIDALL